MMLFKDFLVLFTMCSSLVTSEAIRSRRMKSASTVAPTSYCDSRPIDYFYFQMDVIFADSTQEWESIIASEPVIGASFQPLLDTANELRAGASAIMEAITGGCVSTYPKTVKATKATKIAKSCKAPKSVKEAKSSKTPKSAKEAKSSKAPKAKSSKAPKEGKLAKAKSSKGPKSRVLEEELDVPALILEGISIFMDNVYFMNSYNTPGGTAWSFGPDECGGFEAIPVRDFELVPGAFNAIVCGYKSLVDVLVFTHQELTESNTALDYAAEAETEIPEFYGASSLVSYC